MIVSLINHILFLFRIIARKIRYYYYSLFLGSAGKEILFQGKVYFNNPKHIFIGDNVFIGPFCRIETYKNNNLKPKLSIESDVSIQHAVHIYCANHLEIKKGALIASGCMITDNNHGMNPEGENYLRQPLIYKKTIIEEGVWLGENVAVNSGSHIGERSIIGSNSVVNGEIPPYSIAVGIPAKIIKTYNFETKCWEKVS